MTQRLCALTNVTPRELQILRLLARGATNRQVAEALVISPRTAETHVSNILGKLGLTSRAQAAAITALSHHPDFPSNIRAGTPVLTECARSVVCCSL